MASEKVRILYVQETIGSGGVERRRYNLVRLLDRNKYEFKIVCTNIVGPLADEIRSENVEVIAIGSLLKVWDTTKYKAVLDVIKRYNPHIIHGAVFEGVLLATIAGSLGRVPIIIAEETSVPIKRTKKATFLLKVLSLLADKVVGVSPAAYDYLKHQANIGTSKLKLIVNGVSIPPVVSVEDSIKLKGELGIREDDFIVGCVGRLFNGVKRVTDLIDAISILNIKSTRYKLLIVGDGPDKDYIYDYAKAYGVSNNVIMVGYQFNPHPFYKLMNIFALVSSTESFGLAAVEAMFHKLPVIATDIGGLKHVVVNNETGYLVEVKKPDQIAEAVINISNSNTIQQQMGEKGYNRAHREFGVQRYVSDVENLYRELLVQKGINTSAKFGAFPKQ